MYWLYGTLPRENPDLHHQTDLSEISDDDFRKAWDPPTFTLAQRIIQVIFFIIFGGWIRGILMVVVSVLYVIIVSPWIALAHRLDIVGPYVYFGQQISQYYIRAMAFCFGIMYIKYEGEPDPETRQFSYNHVSIADGPLIYIHKVFTVAMVSGIRDVPLFGRIALVSSTIFIDRSKREGNSLLLKQGIEDKTKPPIAIAPEGKVTDGSVVLKFRTGGFLSDEQIQPCSIRYRYLFPWSGGTINWIVDGFFEFVWLALACPGAIATVRFLEPIKKEQLTGKTPEQRAEMVQLVIANDLGVRAVNRTSKEIFAVLEKEKTE